MLTFLLMIFLLLCLSFLIGLGRFFYVLFRGKGRDGSYIKRHNNKKQPEKPKVFDDDEGEYVDYEEVTDNDETKKES